MPRLAVRMTRLAALFLGLAATNVRAADGEPIPPEAAAFLNAEAEAIVAAPLPNVGSAEEWQASRPEHQRRLRAMLGLDPLPPRTDLKAEVRGVVERPDFVVERILYQSSPGLFVTANLYRPKTVEKPLPAILYVCGHATVEKNGAIHGNKTHYQHHAAWYAANGYVCLVVDTLQLGEVPGRHHGTHHLGRWWWQSRGYSPAGVEVWNGMRGLDYLLSRPEVDPDRLGVAGRSGGGATSWHLAAVDDRLKVVVPAAGITDLRDHLVAGAPGGLYPEGVIDGHCDCMFIANSDRWDYAMVAALVAPKALLIENTRADPIFPEAGVRRIHERLKPLYDRLGARDRLGLLIGEGGHVDSPELRHAEFAWFEKHFKGDAAQPLEAIREPDRAIPTELLKVLEPGKPLPENANDTIDETFVPAAVPPEPTAEAWSEARDRLRARAIAAAFPPGVAPGEPRFGEAAARSGLAMTAVDLEPGNGTRRRSWLFHAPGAARTGAVELIVATAEDWERLAAVVDGFERDGDPSSSAEFAALKAKADAGTRTALLAPMGIGRSSWPASRDASVRRRFALAGRSLDGWRAIEVGAAMRALREPASGPLTVDARGGMAAVALWASILEGPPTKLILRSPPPTPRDGPAFLGLGRILDMPQAVALVYPADVRIESSPPSAWSWTRTLADRLGSARPWPEIVP